MLVQKLFCIFVLFDVCFTILSTLDHLNLLSALIYLQGFYKAWCVLMVFEVIMLHPSLLVFAFICLVSLSAHTQLVIKYYYDNLP